MSLGKKKMLHQAADSGVVNTENFAPVTYTGNGSTQSITTGFQPDLVWLKSRSATWEHFLQDSVRGAANYLRSNSTGAEGTTGPNIVSSFDTNGFTVLGNGNSNNNNDTYVAWCWKAGGAAVSNTDGAITSQVSANQDAGFAIQSWTAGSGVDSVGHGLGITPDLIIIKQINGVQDWWTWTNALTGSEGLRLNRNYQVFTGDSNIFGGSSSHDSSVFYFNGTNSANYISYTFANVDGYQKVGSYTGDGTTNGTKSINVGFQPRFVLIKSSSATGEWLLWDSERLDGVQHEGLYPSTSGAESPWPNSEFNIITTGFTAGRAGIADNYNNNNLNVDYIYLAIA